VIDCILWTVTTHEGWREPPVVILALLVFSGICIWPAWIGFDRRNQ
jgi:hypothetical protein